MTWSHAQHFSDGKSTTNIQTFFLQNDSGWFRKRPSSDKSLVCKRTQQGGSTEVTSIPLHLGIVRKQFSVLISVLYIGHLWEGKRQSSFGGAVFERGPCVAPLSDFIRPLLTKKGCWNFQPIKINRQGDVHFIYACEFPWNAQGKLVRLP